jgi:hypothetical protein
MKYLYNSIDRGKNGNATLCKFICFHLHEDNPNIGLSDKDPESLSKLMVSDFMEKDQLTSTTPPPNPSRSFMNYKKLGLEIPLMDIYQSQY